MKTNFRNLFLLPVLMTGFGLVPTACVTAQTYTTLHSFTATIYTGPPNYVYTNSDGAFPNNIGGLILSDNTLYGTASGGGSSGVGTVFAVNSNGTGFTNLHSFTGNSDGANPYAGLLLSGSTLYGTAAYGGSSAKGTVFKLNTDGTGFTNLHSFTGGDGENPYPSLILSGNTLYGTANRGGSSGQGTVFAVNTNGSGFTNLHSFAGIPNDGAYPTAGLILTNSILYGTASGGGGSGHGTVFALNSNGTGFTNLHNFTAISDPFNTNSDGAYPYAGLILSGNTLYGTAVNGGNAGNGTIFSVNVNGTGFTNLHSFTGNSDGANPYAGLLLSGSTLYGTATYGGSSGNGTVFSRSLLLPPPPPQLTLIPYGANVILTWPTDAAGFTLQSTTNLVSSAVWSVVSPGPVVIGGQNVVFNPVSGSQKFYRLNK